MERHQVHIIEQLARQMSLGQGEVLRLASEIVGHEIPTLYDLTREQSDVLIVALDSLVGVG